MAIGNDDTVTIGSNAPSLGGNLDAIQGPILMGAYAGASADVIIDDSGNTTTARNASLVSYDFLGVTYGTIQGFGPSSIGFRDDENLSIDLRGGTLDDRFLMSGDPFATAVSVDAGAGNDVLVGSGGNTLRGGTGRDLLIAGQTASSLYGGGDDDILIAGTTAHDTNLSNLNAIMTEWTSGAAYSSRAATLRAGWLNADSVSSNDDFNILRGESGFDLFFADIDGIDLPNSLDWEMGEIVYDI